MMSNVSVAHSVGPSVAIGDPSAEIVANILRAAHRLRAVLASHFAEFGLTDVRFCVLKIIRSAAPFGCSQAELANRLQQSESSISTLVERMRDSGLLYRLRSKTDRRKRLLMLSDQGREMLDRVELCHGKWMVDVLPRLDREQKQLLAELLRQLVEELGRLQSTSGRPGNQTEPGISKTRAQISEETGRKQATGVKLWQTTNLVSAERIDSIDS